MKACGGELTLEKHRWQHVLISKQVNPMHQLKGIVLARSTSNFITKIEMTKLNSKQMKKHTVLRFVMIKGLEIKSGCSKRFVIQKLTQNVSINKL